MRSRLRGQQHQILNYTWANSPLCRCFKGGFEPVEALDSAFQREPVGRIANEIQRQKDLKFLKLCNEDKLNSLISLLV